MPSCVASAAVVFGGTEEALWRYRRRAWAWFLLGVGALVGGVVAVGGGWGGKLAAWGAGAGTVVLVVGAGSLVQARRMRVVLSAGPWVACATTGVPAGLGAPRVVLRDPWSGVLWPFTVAAVRQRYGLAAPGPDGVLWWCGDPWRGGVVARPGGESLVWVRPTRTRGRRLKDVRRAEEAGLPGQFEPRQPQPTPDGGPPTLSARVQPPYRRPVFRWITLVGAVLLGLGIAGAEAAEGDPQVDLTVLSEDRQGNCTVTWRDPDSGERREGPYQCDPDRDPLLHDWETGWVVSYGPWKGDLYNSDWQGTPANTVNQVFGLGGLLILGGSAVGGAIRVGIRVAERRAAQGPALWGPSEARPMPEPRSPGPSAGQVPAGGSTAPAEADLSYAAFCAAARRKVVSPAPSDGTRHEADVRTGPWWRVRTLLRTSQLDGVLAGVACLVGAILLGWLGLGPWPALLVLALFGGVQATVSGYRAVVRGLPAVRAVVRAARAPLPVVTPYVLLPEPGDATPVLVLFPAHAQPDSPPEAVLAVCHPGPAGRPWAGLPGPVGEADLRGWLDEGPTVVPWIGGRALWPLHELRDVRIGVPEDREYLAALVGESRDD
ncbi:hypothetical protein [Streptomyces flavofungini]|uniref:hypothetical protein n=1 Tax=Streptomyces flavofungini TaxID=68200 RepID=UPI0025B0B845|nr:hypothetical protein [Streptomyces flavofungini]WJV45588.1 hypothetical protein QUY26_08595 [Streptomyces flavofungini]